MKSFLSFLIVCAFSIFSLQAAILTVDNNTNSAGQYTDLQTAFNAASPGDTIHIIGSQAPYLQARLEKRLTLIGAGYNSPNQFNFSTTITTLYLSESLPNNASGSVIMGCNIATLSWWVNSDYDNITIERCNISSLLTMRPNACSGWLIQNNIVNAINVGDNGAVVIRNNIIRHQILNSDEGTVLITNNVFTKNFTTPYFSNVSAAMITNNIFYQGGGPTGCTSSTFNNNITYATSNNTLPYGTNTGSANMVGSNPLFNNVTGMGFDYANDYRLASNSPGLNAGTDGTDIGIYGNTQPFPIGGAAPFLTSANPRVPQIMELNLLNATIFQGDSLTVQVKARKQN
ncbi:MAG: hypothetical protein AAF587_12415 [Bacteroidota bacterium]